MRQTQKLFLFDQNQNMSALPEEVRSYLVKISGLLTEQRAERIKG